MLPRASRPDSCATRCGKAALRERDCRPMVRWRGMTSNWFAQSHARGRAQLPPGQHWTLWCMPRKGMRRGAVREISFGLSFSIYALGALLGGGRQSERRTIAHHDVTRRRQSDGALPFHLGEGARDRLDCEAEIVGNVGPRHRQIEILRTDESLGNSEQKSCNALASAFAPQKKGMIASVVYGLRSVLKPAAGGAWIITGRLLES